MAQISFTPSLFGSLPSKISLRESSQKLKNSLSLHLREWPHRDSSVTRTASIRRACVSWRTRLRVSRLFLAPEAVSFEDAEHLETATIGEGGELGNLPLAGLIGGGDPGVDGGALSQLNSLGSAVGNQLILLVRYLSRTD